MKNVRPNFTDEHGQFYSEISDENTGRSFISGWVIEDDYFVATSECPKFDPRDGSALVMVD